MAREEFEIETSTDTVEQVKAALGEGVEIEDTAPPADDEAKGGEEDAGEEEAGADESENEAADDEESEEGEQPKDKKTADEKGKETPKEPPKKAAPATVPRARLNEEIEKRKRLERQLNEANSRQPKADTPTDDTPAEPEEPTTFSGKPEPTLEAFTKDVDPFDSKAMGEAVAKFTKAHSAWSREEVDARSEYRTQQRLAEERQIERTKDFRSRETSFIKEHRSDYRDVVSTSNLKITAAMEDYVYESEAGPAILLYWAENPEEAQRFNSMRMATFTREISKLEKQIAKDLKASQADDDAAEAGADEEDEEEEKPAPKRLPVKKPITKTVSKAPLPPNRIKTGAPGPKTEQELAGPTERTGIDIDFNPDYEKAVRDRRK